MTSLASQRLFWCLIGAAGMPVALTMLAIGCAVDRYFYHMTSDGWMGAIGGRVEAFFGLFGHVVLLAVVWCKCVRPVAPPEGTIGRSIYFMVVAAVYLAVSLLPIVLIAFVNFSTF